MNKMNKKGFTLIEMLVVIAIIAVLVSIVVPVVSNSTVKAAAATNAANLRTVAAQIGMLKLEDPTLETADFTVNDGGTITVTVNGTERTIEAPEAKAVDLGDVAVEKGADMDVEVGADNIKVTYTGTNGDIKHFAEIADGTVTE